MKVYSLAVAESGNIYSSFSKRRVDLNGNSNMSFLLMFDNMKINEEDMRKIMFKSVAFAAVGSMMMVGSAFGLPILTIHDGVVADVVIDDSINAAIADGIVSFSGAFGNTNLTIAAGTSAPQTGTFTDPNMHLNAFVTGGNRLLTFTLEDTFTSFDAGITGWLTQFALAGAGSGTLDVTLNGISVASFLADGPDQYSSYMGGTSPYHLVMKGTIQAVLSGATSFDADISSVPEPTTMLLFGAGIAGLASYRRKK